MGIFSIMCKNPLLHLDQTCVTRALATPLSPAPLASLLNLVALREPMTGLAPRDGHRPSP